MVSYIRLLRWAVDSLPAVAKIIRWSVIALLIGAGAVILLTPSKYEQREEAGITVVQYWEKWTGEEARQMQIIVDDFNRTVGKEKKIRVECVSMSSIDQKTLVATAAGVPPDVAGLWDAQVVQFAAMDALEPLEEMAASRGLTREYYKPVYWDACTWNGHLWALISTPAAIVLHYDKEALDESADKLRAAGFDPNVMPRTIAELDRMGDLLTIYDANDKTKIKRSGHLPLEPGWYVALFPYWFGGSLLDEKTQTLTIHTPQNTAAYDWIASYSRKYGVKAFDQFRQGLGNFASAQNAFLSGRVAMEQQGPWMSNFIEKYAPKMNRWHVPQEKLDREANFDRLNVGMPEADVRRMLGEPMKQDGSAAVWDAGIKWITCIFADGKLASKQADLLPAVERRKYTQWGAAPFPNAVSPDKVIAFCPFDSLVIPKGAKHKTEAFEFIAYVNRPEVMEKLCMMHCKNSPLAKTSDYYTQYHPNPYIEVFDKAAESEGAFAVPKIAIWPEVADVLNSEVSQSCYLLAKTADTALDDAAKRLDSRWAYFRKVQEERAGK